MHRFSLVLFFLTSFVTAQGPVVASDFLVRVWQNEEGLQGNVVRSLGQSSDGFLWVATAEGVARFDGIEFEDVSSNLDQGGPPLDTFRIFTPVDGSVWVASFSGGLLRFQDGQLERILDDMADQFKVITRSIIHGGNPYFIRGGEIWTIKGHDAIPVPTASSELTAALDADRHLQELRGRYDVAKNPMSLADRDGGEWLLQSGSLRYVPNDNRLLPPPIPDFNGRLVANDLLEDREGNLWVASPVQGLIRIRRRQVTPLATSEGIHDEAVQAALQDSHGTWWLANRNGGVDRILNGVSIHHDIPATGTKRTVSCIFEDSRDQLWFATRDASVFRWNGESFEAMFGNLPAFSKINSIAEDAEGRLWFGGWQRLWQWDRAAAPIDFSEDPLLRGATFSTLSVGSTGNLIAGTLDGRIFDFDEKSFSLLGNPEDLGGRGISTILALDPGEIWVSTLGKGLFVWNNSRWHRFSRSDGIPDERLTALTIVGDDWFWMGSLGGIIRVSRNELLQRISNHQITPHWMRLDRSNGMMTRECVGGSQPGVYRDREDGLWFPTTAGLAGVKPEHIAINSIPPSLRLHPVEINGLAHSSETGPILAGPGRARLNVRFTGLSLSAPEKVSYRIQLIGIDEYPRFIGTQRQVDYQAVPPGQYRFEVSSMNGDGISSPHPIVQWIEIRPHLWETNWFRALVVISVLLIAISIGWLDARRRMNKRIQELHVSGLLEAERSRISSDLHDDLGASLTELSILSEIATEDPDDVSLRNSMIELSIKAKRVVGALDEIVWATNPTEDSLLSLVEYLPEFAREFLKTVNIPLRAKIEHQIPELSIGPRRRHNILLATREAINNAVKYAQAQFIFMGIAIEGGNLIVQVQDAGRGFDLDSIPTGHGLTNMKNRMTDCGGTCKIESARGKGTTITLTLPLHP